MRRHGGFDTRVFGAAVDDDARAFPRERLAIAKPIPAVDPETKAILPVSCRSIFRKCFRNGGGATPGFQTLKPDRDARRGIRNTGARPGSECYLFFR